MLRWEKGLAVPTLDKPVTLRGDVFLN